MLMELIEKKGQPIKTRYKFTKKEWNAIPFQARCDISNCFEVHETARLIYYDVTGDMLNIKKKNIN